MSEPNADPPKADPPKADPPKADPPKADPPKADPPKADPPAGDPPADKTFTQADIDRAVEKATKEAKKAADAAAAKAKLSEDEKKDATIAELQTSIRMRDAKDDVVAALSKAGARSTGLMWNAVKGELEFDDKGKLTNLDSLVKDLQAEYPDQFGIPKPDGSIDAAGKQDPGQALTKEKLAKMTPAEINAIPWEDVKKVMAAP